MSKPKSPEAGARGTSKFSRRRGEGEGPAAIGIAQPASWFTLPLRLIAEVNPGDTEWGDWSPNTEVSFVPMAAVSESTATIEQRHVRRLEDVRRGFTAFHVGDILLAKITPCMFRTDAKMRMRGAAGQQRVPEDFLREYPVPLPLPSEQRRIVEILDEADRLRRLRAEADAKADRILPALFIKMFEDPRANPYGWDTGGLGDVIVETQYGTSKRASVPRPKCLYNKGCRGAHRARREDAGVLPPYAKDEQRRPVGCSGGRL